jgi:hypothetical protein
MNDQVSFDEDESGVDEMEIYCINLEDWMRQNQESKRIVKLARPTYEPRAKNDQVVCTYIS